MSHSHEEIITPTNYPSQFRVSTVKWVLCYNLQSDLLYLSGYCQVHSTGGWLSTTNAWNLTYDGCNSNSVPAHFVF